MRMSKLISITIIFAFIFFITITILAQTIEQEQPTFTVSTSYKSLLSTPEQTGMLDRIVKEAFNRIGINAEIVFNPTGRSLEDVNEGFADAEINRIAGMEENYPNLIRVPEPNMIMHFVAFSKKDFVIDGWDSIRDLNIGIVQGWKILEDNTAGFPYVILVPTETELFNMMDKNRLDVALYSKLAGYEQLMLRDLKYIYHLEPPLVSREMYLYLHKKHEELVDKVAAALKDMKEDGTYDLIIRETTGHLIPGNNN
jgi:polar amino acid transport system substrate-binding protein